MNFAELIDKGEFYVKESNFDWILAQTEVPEDLDDTRRQIAEIESDLKVIQNQINSSPVSPGSGNRSHTQVLGEAGLISCSTDDWLKRAKTAVSIKGKQLALLQLYEDKLVRPKGGTGVNAKRESGRIKRLEDRINSMSNTVGRLNKENQMLRVALDERVKKLESQKNHVLQVSFLLEKLIDVLFKYLSGSPYAGKRADFDELIYQYSSVRESRGKKVSDCTIRDINLFHQSLIANVPDGEDKAA